MAVDGSSSFRELDDIFLQSQARIWIGEVLHTRFYEHLSIGDLLSDGELLFEVSKALWNMLLVKYMELKSYKARMFVPVDTQKSIGRYRPYANVDLFLKVCKVMGLSGVDLFSPSDVVEKRDPRKVCVCIRSLSIKARSKQLNVPDFDIVTNTIAMSTDAVRCIRGSLELSSMSGITCKQSKHARLKTRQKTSCASHKQEESYLEESDEENSHFSDKSYVDFLYLETGESPETADKYALTHSIRKSDASNRELNKFGHSPVSVLLQYVNSENQLEETLSMCRVCRKLLDDVEASPTSSVLGRVLDFDFDAKSESDDLTTLESFTYDKKVSVLDRYADSSSPGWDDTKSCCSVDQDHESMNKIKRDSGHFLVSMKDDVTNISDSIQENVTAEGSNFKLMKMNDPKSTHNIDDVFNDLVDVKFSERYDCCAEDTSKAAATKDGKKDDGLAKADTNKQNDERAFNTEKKPSYVAPLLKTVAKGTAVIGIMFLLHLRFILNNKLTTVTATVIDSTVHNNNSCTHMNTRNRSVRNTSQIHWKSNGMGFSNRKEEKGSKIYPVEKFKFED